jgi:hypothetical protein
MNHKLSPHHCLAFSTSLCAVKVWKLTQFLIVLSMTAASCAQALTQPTGDISPETNLPLPAVRYSISLTHFNHLYEEYQIDGKPMGVVHIYSRFPSYDYAAEPKEGFTCVDDVARAIVMLVREWRHEPDAQQLLKIQRMVEFVLHQQNSNGYFNNFIWSDLSTNLTYKTSVAELNWWSLRALWSLEEAYPLFDHDPAIANRISKATDLLVKNLERDLPVGAHITTIESGVELPTWLPAGSGADQAAEAILGLLPHYRRTQRPGARRLVEALGDGILMMQKGSAETYPYGLFLSWRNTWHAWGNIQAYAMLIAGEELGRHDYISSALREIDHFYPYLLKSGLAESIRIRSEHEHKFSEIDRHRYAQIAYGMRPMIFAAMKAYAMTKDDKYRALGQRLGAWFFGKNDADTPMYHSESGMGFDGITALGQVNRDSGAESTIETLLAVQALRDGTR